MDPKPTREQSPEALALRARLNDLKGQWADIALRSGVPYSTLQKVAQGVILEPRLVVYMRLIGALPPAQIVPDASGEPVTPSRAA